jgi:hypothetical protein
MSVKHLPAYLDEMEWRFNNRENPYLFRDTLLVLLHGATLPYHLLIECDGADEHQCEYDALMQRKAMRQARRRSSWGGPRMIAPYAAEESSVFACSLSDTCRR